MYEITMTPDETAIYDAAGPDWDRLRLELTDRATELTGDDGGLVEIYTAELPDRPACCVEAIDTTPMSFVDELSDAGAW